MTQDELIDLIRRYPTCWAAATYVEEIIAVPVDGDGPETAWDLMMGVSPPLTPAEVADMIRSEFEPITGSRRADDYSDLVRRQLSDPSFVTYVAGRMGAV